MSSTRFDEADIKRKVPKKVLERVKENMEEYHMLLSDAFEEAARELAKPGTLLFKAWYHSDFREYIPGIYKEEYLDFEKYPLKYNIKEENMSNEAMNEEKEINKEDEPRICGVMYDHGDGIYGLGEGFVLTAEEQKTIQDILDKYIDEGWSFYGTKKDIAEQILEVCEPHTVGK